MPQVGNIMFDNIKLEDSLVSPDCLDDKSLLHSSVSITAPDSPDSPASFCATHTPIKSILKNHRSVRESSQFAKSVRFEHTVYSWLFPNFYPVMDNINSEENLMQALGQMRDIINLSSTTVRRRYEIASEYLTRWVIPDDVTAEYLLRQRIARQIVSISHDFLAADRPYLDVEFLTDVLSAYSHTIERWLARAGERLDADRRIEQRTGERNAHVWFHVRGEKKRKLERRRSVSSSSSSSNNPPSDGDGRCEVLDEEDYDSQCDYEEALALFVPITVAVGQTVGGQVVDSSKKSTTALDEEADEEMRHDSV